MTTRNLIKTEWALLCLQPIPVNLSLSIGIRLQEGNCLKICNGKSHNVWYVIKNKTFSPCFHSLVRTKAIQLESAHNLCQGFHQAMKAQRACFISFIKLLFLRLLSLKKKRERERERPYKKSVCIVLFPSWKCKFSHLEDSKSHCSRHSCFIGLWKHWIVDQRKHTYYPNYFIKFRKSVSNVSSGTFTYFKVLLFSSFWN